MIQFTYIAAILLSLTGLLLCDYRYKLVLFKNERAGLIAIFVAWAGLLIWDFIGINQGIFFSPSPKYALNIYVANELPIEELLLLIVIVYTPLIIWTTLRRGVSANV